jgi:hypothetical protein
MTPRNKHSSLFYSALVEKKKMYLCVDFRKSFGQDDLLVVSGNRFWILYSFFALSLMSITYVINHSKDIN